MFSIKQEDKCSNARMGDIKLNHGEVKTPVFMPVGTLAAVKAISPSELNEIGAQIILSNAYHLYLRPGADLIAGMGGLHKFMGWDKPILTDSGGFQVFSLSKTLKINDDGVHFQSHIDGSKHFYTPELAMEVQGKLGSDIAMIFDQPTPYPADKKQAEEAVIRTTRWAKRSKASANEGQATFGIVQGSVYSDLRKRSVEEIVEIGFDGYALGGFSVGEPLELMYELVEEIAPLLPKDKPRYLMGVGDPVSLVKCISYGIDMFDCVLPTRMGRNGAAFTSTGKINIKNAQYTKDDGPLDEKCECAACQNFSRAYLRYTYNNNEILSHRLLSIHNLNYLTQLVNNAKEAIINNNINELIKKTKEIYDEHRNS